LYNFQWLILIATTHATFTKRAMFLTPQIHTNHNRSLRWSCKILCI